MATLTPKRKLPLFRVMLLGVALLAVVGFAYNVFFGRRGEAAIAMIPADATLVVTVDLVPSQAQIPAFKRIADAMKREGLDHQLEDSAGSAIGSTALGKELRPYLQHNMAFATWNTADGKSSEVLLLPVSDKSQVSALLQKHGSKVDQSGTVSYKIGEQNRLMVVIGDYLVSSESAALLRRVQLTHDGAEKPVAQLPQYIEARNALPSDANLMVFVSPQGLSEAGKAAGTQMTRSAKWMCFGAAIRDNGIRIDFRSPLEKDMVPPAGAGFLDPNFLAKVPTGALGIVAVADPANTLEWVQKGLGKEKGAAEGIQAFEKESGISVTQDIVPALGGDLLIGVYPGASQKPIDLEAVLLVDSNNGADPAALATKIRTKIESDSAKDPKPVKFTRSQYGGAEVWAMDAAATKEISDSAKEAGMGAKSPCLALIGKAIIMASSKPMMFTAIRAYRGTASLSTDPAFAAMSSQMTDRAQAATLISIHRVLDRMRPEFEKSKNMLISADDIVNVFGGENDGLVISGYVLGDQMVGTAFLPLDYDRAAKGIKSMSSPPRMSDPGSATK
ncbi:MAG: DUF3352 domain-containing protein [Fimbriimonas sp.]